MPAVAGNFVQFPANGGDFFLKTCKYMVNLGEFLVQVLLSYEFPWEFDEFPWELLGGNSRPQREFFKIPAPSGNFLIIPLRLKFS